MIRMAPRALKAFLVSGGLFLFPIAAQAQISPTHITVPNPGAVGFPSVLTGAQLDFGQTIYSPDGQISHTVTAVELYQHLLPMHINDPEPTYTVVTRRIVLWSKSFQWVADVGMFPPRAITQDQALALGATQAQISGLGSPDPNLTGAGLLELSFEEACTATDNGTGNLYPWVSGGDRRQGILNLVVDVPATASSMWRLGVTSALGEVRYTGLVLSPGPQFLRVTNVEAGNCLVSMTAITSNNLMTTFHREMPVIVRKDTPGLASMSFVTISNDPRRYRLFNLAVGQNSQNENGAVALTQSGALPLIQNRAAMVRVMAYDALGAGPEFAGNPFNIKVDVLNASGQSVWSTALMNHKITTHLTQTGRLVPSNAGPAIPAQYVQAGMKVQATLIDPITNLTLDTLGLQPSVIPPRKIVIHGYDVRPYAGDRGCPVARTPSQMNAWILPYNQEVFPYSDISYQYDGKVWLMDYGQFPARGISTTTAALLVMNIMQGMHQTDNNATTEHLYVAFLNQKYGSATYPGMAWYGYRGAALTRIDGDPHPGPFDEGLGYNLAHEMGHCFGFEHAPSSGASSYSLGFHFNRVDGNYQYGGAGLAGGWGYSALGNYFLSEDAQTTYYNNRPGAHWDPMSYSYYGLRDYSQQRFSDLYTQRLLPGFAAPQAPTIGGVDSSSISLATLPSGIKVLDATSVAQTQAWFQGTTSPATPVARPVTPLPNGTDPLLGVDPSKGDPDDPTPPVIIVIQTPAIPGVTVPQ